MGRQRGDWRRVTQTDYLLAGHRCREIARMSPCMEGRVVTLGELLEPLPDHPHETHCIHIATPLKSVVFGVCGADFEMLAVFGYLIGRPVLNEHWMEAAAAKFRRNTEKEAAGDQGH